MTDQRVATVAAVALVVVALGVAAATVDSGELAASDPHGGGGADEPSRPPEVPSYNPGAMVTCPAALSTPAVLGGVLAVAGLLGVVSYRLLRSPVLAAVAAVPLPVAFAGACPGAVPAVGFPGVTVPAIRPSPALLIGVLVVALAGSLALLYVRTGSAEPFETAASDDAGTDLQAVGAAAGAAADRIEATQASVDNEVYRAWREMTDHLDVDQPETTTPAEFADAAVDAGMGERDVATLTRLFEEVRYGERDPERRAERAVEALRGIERAYGGDGQ